MSMSPARALTSTQSDSYLSYDAMMMGGASIIFCLCSWMFMDKSSAINTIGTLAFALAFICNHPHFLSSYILLYGDYRKRIVTQRSYFWAAVIVPILLGGTIIGAWVRGDARMMAHVITAMYFFVGWHYVKQVFGCIIVTSAQRKIYYTKAQRNLILFNLFTTWFMSWAQSHVGGGSFQFYGISHYSLGLPPWTMIAIYALSGVSFLGIVALQTRMYIDKGVLPSPPAVMALLALYAWYIPSASHPGFAYLIPFFHSLQYLAFVGRLKGNEVRASLKGLADRQWRLNFVKRLGGWALGALVLGALAFEIIPDIMDAQGWIPANGAMGTNPMLAGILLFINIHHYFIDNVIWRSNNETVKRFLFQSESTEKISAVPLAKVG